jgi:hypothetical protein
MKRNQEIPLKPSVSAPRRLHTGRRGPHICGFALLQKGLSNISKIQRARSEFKTFGNIPGNDILSCQKLCADLRREEAA